MIASVALGLLQAAAAMAAAAAAAPGEFRLTVLHTNDLHSHYDETCRGGGGGPCGAAGGHGGFARLRGALDAERARAAADGAPPAVVHLYAGDSFHGTRFYDVLRWQPAAELIGDLGVDAMVRDTTRYRVLTRSGITSRFHRLSTRLYRFRPSPGNSKISK